MRERGIVRASVIALVAVLLAAFSWLVLARRGDDRAAAGPAHTATAHSARMPAATGPHRSVTAASPTPTGATSSAPGRVAPVAVDPCARNRGREVLVSLDQQREWLCSASHVHASFAVTTGRHRPGDRTPTGTYAIQARTRNTILNPSSGGSFHVKYWLPFKLGIYGFHDAPWQTIPFGSPRYTSSGSQGCVHMRTQDIARLFAWVQLGTRVRIVKDTVSD